jgi:hypothetical protein
MERMQPLDRIAVATTTMIGVMLELMPELAPENDGGVEHVVRTGDKLQVTAAGAMLQLIGAIVSAHEEAADGAGLSEEGLKSIGVHDDETLALLLQNCSNGVMLAAARLGLLNREGEE